MLSSYWLFVHLSNAAAQQHNGNDRRGFGTQECCITFPLSVQLSLSSPGCSHDTRDDLVQPSNLIVHLCICYIYSPTDLRISSFCLGYCGSTPFLLASPSMLPWLQRASHANISNHPFNSVHDGHHPTPHGALQDGTSAGWTFTRFLPVFELFFSFKTSSQTLNTPRRP